MNWNSEGWHIDQPIVYKDDTHVIQYNWFHKTDDGKNWIEIMSWDKVISGHNSFAVCVWRKKAPKTCGDNCGCKDVTECDLPNVLTTN